MTNCSHPIPQSMTPATVQPRATGCADLQLNVERTAAICRNFRVCDPESGLGDDESMGNLGLPFEPAHHKPAIRVASSIRQRSPVAHHAVNLYQRIGTGHASRGRRFKYCPREYALDSEVGPIAGLEKVRLRDQPNGRVSLIDTHRR